MQYALVRQNTPDLIRIEVAQALRRRDLGTCQSYVQRGDIVHARHAEVAADLFCIYCGGPLFVEAALKRAEPRSIPHFEHYYRGDAARTCAARELDTIRHTEGERLRVSWLDAIPLEGRQYGVYSNPGF
jgi:hypothetical protein